MDPQVDGKVAVVTGASRGIGLAVTRALAENGAICVAGARDTSPELDELADLGVVSVTGRPQRHVRGRPADRRGTRARPPRHPDQQRRRRHTTHQRLPDDHRRTVADDPLAEPAHRRTHHSCRAALDADRRTRQHRHHQLDQRSAARPHRHRLQRRQGSPHELLQGTLQGDQPARHQDQHGQPRTSRHRAVARQRRRRGHPRPRPGRATRRSREERRKPIAHRNASPSPGRSPTSSCSSPATPSPETSPARTS